MSTVASNIQLTNISDDLKRVREVEQGKKRSNACLFNLIVYAEVHTKEIVYNSIVDSVISKFPCRLILISSHQSSEEILRTKVATKSVAEGIFCEIIEIEVGGSLQNRVPFLILPHIIADLPLYLLWTVDPSQDKTILPYFESYATKVILSPALEIDLSSFSQNVLQLTERLHCAVSDLSWSALRPLRRIFASAFETHEHFLGLTSAKLMRITYARICSPFVQNSSLKACYFQAYVAACLGWQFKSIEAIGDDIRLIYTKASQEIIVLLLAQENPFGLSQMPNGTLLSIDIDCSYKKANMNFVRNPSSNQVVIQYSDQDKCDLPIVAYLAGMKEGQEIIEEIFYSQPSPHYKKMLECLSNTPWNNLA
jgi:glucose-6-phosphate dehydrogenase assembly protein OpcA